MNVDGAPGPIILCREVPGSDPDHGCSNRLRQQNDQAYHADTRRVGRCAFDYRAMPGLAAGALMPSSDNPARRTLNRYVALVCVIVSTLGVFVFAYAINV